MILKVVGLKTTLTNSKLRCCYFLRKGRKLKINRCYFSTSVNSINDLGRPSDIKHKTGLCVYNLRLNFDCDD